MAEEHVSFGHRLEPHIADTARLCWDVLDAGRTVIFEGAQATLLDLDHGTYPFVTSSNPIAGAATVGAGVGPTDIRRSGASPRPTRPASAPAPSRPSSRTRSATLVERGHEFGTTTGRRRRTGWMDLIALRYAVRLNRMTRSRSPSSTSSAASNRCGSPSATARREGAVLDSFPYHQSILHSATPEYEELPGFDGTSAPAAAGPTCRGGTRLPRLHRRLRRRPGPPGRRRPRPRSDHLARLLAAGLQGPLSPLPRFYAETLVCTTVTEWLPGNVRLG